MLLQALFITVIGMGGVFTFLLILMAGMTVLRICAQKTERQPMEKIAATLAVALHETQQERGNT